MVGPRRGHTRVPGIRLEVNKKPQHPERWLVALYSSLHLFFPQRLFNIMADPAFICSIVNLILTFPCVLAASANLKQPKPKSPSTYLVNASIQLLLATVIVVLVALPLPQAVIGIRASIFMLTFLDVSWSLGPSLPQIF